jgi:hypothetical protein
MVHAGHASKSFIKSVTSGQAGKESRMNAIEPVCANSARCPKRDACARHHVTPAEHQIYASYFILGAEQCSGYQEKDNATH